MSRCVRQVGRRMKRRSGRQGKPRAEGQAILGSHLATEGWKAGAAKSVRRRYQCSVGYFLAAVRQETSTSDGDLRCPLPAARCPRGWLSSDVQRASAALQSVFSELWVALRGQWREGSQSGRRACQQWLFTISDWLGWGRASRPGG
jgi:hypothetical protein